MVHIFLKFTATDPNRSDLVADATDVTNSGN
jgi:hypothetical protein